MAILTLEELQKKHPNAIAKKVFTLEQIQSKQAVDKATAGNQFTQLDERGRKLNKVAGFFGGKELARGLGMSLAAPSVQKDLTAQEKQLSDQAFKLVKKINENKKLGKDTSRLEKALVDLKGTQTIARDVQKDFVSALPSSRQVIGSSLRLGATAGAGVIGGALSKLTALGKATGVVSGAVRGLATGAGLGAVEGAAQGFGLGLEEDKTTAEAGTQAAIGAGLGAVTGGIIGSIGGAVSGGLQGRKIKTEEFTKEFVTPKQSSKIRAEAIQQGRLEDPSLFEKAKISYSKRDEQLASAVDDIVSPQNTLGENIDAIRYKINQTNSGIKTYITKNKIPFNTNQLKSRLEAGKGDLELVFASDQNAEKTYNAVVNAFMKNLEKKDTLGLFQARQDFDKLPAVRKLLESDRLGENARKEIVLTVRRMANDYIAGQLPTGNQYRDLLMNESYMIEALGNISEKAQSIIGKNKLQILTEEYPLLKWLVGGAAVAVTSKLLGALGGGVGVGGTVIGSTD